LPQSLQERSEARLPYRVIRRRTDQHTDPPHPLALLRRCAAQQRDELAASQLIEEHSVPY
jgi:hypothetical protein